MTLREKANLAEKAAREAGGRVTSFREGDDPLRTGRLIATNGRIHSHLQQLLLQGDLSLLDKD